MSNIKVLIDVPLVQRLISMQFPQWADLPIKPVAVGGWAYRHKRRRNSTKLAYT
ncbi:MAG: hypothetical protein K2Y08_07685 [Alphaproteobacteria bacterium]|nr:hypothetical protein [Alphaproteobacteria bacterium]